MTQKAWQRREGIYNCLVAQKGKFLSLSELSHAFGTEINTDMVPSPAEFYPYILIRIVGIKKTKRVVVQKILYVGVFDRFGVEDKQNFSLKIVDKEIAILKTKGWRDIAAEIIGFTNDKNKVRETINFDRIEVG